MGDPRDAGSFPLRSPLQIRVMSQRALFERALFEGASEVMRNMIARHVLGVTENQESSIASLEGVYPGSTGKLSDVALYARDGAWRDGPYLDDC